MTLDGIMGNIDSSQLIAQQTGGRAFFNTNDLGGAIARATEDSNLTYVLGYYPTHGKWDGRFREIKVRVRNGVDVRHRKGYFALPAVPVSVQTRENVLFDALSSPLDSTGVGVSVGFEPIAPPHEFRLAIRVEPDSVQLRQEGETWVGAMDIAIAQTLPDSRLFNSLDVTVPLRFTTAQRDNLLRDGITFNRTLSLRPDVHQIRIVIRDSSGSVGTVTIPAARLRREPKLN